MHIVFTSTENWLIAAHVLHLMIFIYLKRVRNGHMLAYCCIVYLLTSMERRDVDGASLRRWNVVTSMERRYFDGAS